MQKVNLKSFNNAWFNHGASFFKRGLWYLVNAIFINSYILPLSGLKKFLLTLFGAKIGRGVVIKPKVNIKFPWKLAIGNHVWIGEEVWIDNLSEVTIGDNSCLSQGAMLLTGNHDFTKSTFDLTAKPITLEEGSWVGARAVVCPGVTFGSHAILTVGSIATKNLDSFAIYQGNPAQKIKTRNINDSTHQRINE